jgi:hypothetical protein
MKRAAPALILLAYGCFVAAPPVRFGAGKSAQEAQQQEVAELSPPVLATDPTWTGEVQTAKIRVWADDQFRAQNLSWEKTFQEELDYANAVLAANFGVRLQAEYRVWDRHAPDASIEEDLAALARQDPGNDVLIVVGLTSSLALVTATFDHIGVASLPGKHLMLRGYADRWERDAFDRAFPKIPADQRENLAEARRRHKTTAVLLHELGHNFGAPHEADENTIMAAIYSEHCAAFSPRAHDIILATLDERLHRTHSIHAAAAAPVFRHPSLIIHVSTDGKVTVGGMAVDDATLDELLHQSYGDDHDTAVVIRAEHGTPHATVMHVFDHARAAGLGHLTLEDE